MQLKELSLFGKDGKHCGKRRKCWLPEFSSFPTMFSKHSCSESSKVVIVWSSNLQTVLAHVSLCNLVLQAQSDVALTINHPQQLLIMGVSKDLGRCKGTTKAGTMCGNFINR